MSSSSVQLTPPPPPRTHNKSSSPEKDKTTSNNNNNLNNNNDEILTSTPNNSNSNTPPNTLAFNGGTFTRGKKERKGLYFITGEDENVHGSGEATTTSSSSSVHHSPEVGTSATLTSPVVVAVDPATAVTPSSNSSTKGMKESHTPSSPDGDSGGGTSNSLISVGEEENFECLGESINSSFNATGGSNNNSKTDFGLNDNSDLMENSSTSRGSPLSRNGWQRTSLRRNVSNSSNGATHSNGDHLLRRVGSFRANGSSSTGNKRSSSTMMGIPPSSTNALASHLYHRSSYSSGRSSAGEGDPDDFNNFHSMADDSSSLEGEVNDLTKKVHHLEEKFTVLVENQNDVDDRYNRLKQENAELKTRLYMLEEQMRDEGQRAEDKLREEVKRNKDMMARIEREKLLELENLEIKLQMTEEKLTSAKNETKRLETFLEKERIENRQLSEKCMVQDRELFNLREENRELVLQNRMETAGSQQALEELNRQLESLRQFHNHNQSNGGISSGTGSFSMYHNHHQGTSLSSEEPEIVRELRSRLKEAEDEIKRLKNLNIQLQESNEDLSAQLLHQGLENGRHLLKEGIRTQSLAAEFEAMSQDEMKTALKDQKEANAVLRQYIDGILLNIVEHYPQLLEVRSKSSIVPLPK